MKRNRQKCAVVMGLMLAACGSAQADTATGEARLEQIVVTATRTEESAFDVPMPVEVVTQKSLVRQSPATVAEPLGELPGVSVGGTGFWEASPVIRGLGGSRVLVLIDGDRESNLWAGRAPLIPFVDVSAIEKIEVIKGPASALYGTDALGGVVNIITKRAALAHNDYFSLNHDFDGRYSSVDNGYLGRYGLSGGGRGLDFNLAVSKRGTDDYRDGDGNKVANSQYQAVNIDFMGRYYLNPDHDISFLLRDNRIGDQGVPQKNMASYSHFTKFDTDSYKFIYHGRQIGLLQDLQIKGWYDDQQRIYSGNIHSDSQPMYTLKGNSIDTSVAGASLQGKLEPVKDQSLVFGMEYFQEKTDSSEQQTALRDTGNTIAKITSFKPVPNSTREHFGIYSQYEAHVGSSWILLGGLRYDYFVADADDVAFNIRTYNTGGVQTGNTTSYNRFHKKSDDAVTFNAGVLYALTEGIHLTGNFASGFRAPDVFERYSTRGGSYIILGDPELKSEYSYSVDLGSKMEFAKSRGAINFFYNRITNYIDLVNNGTLFAGLPTREYVNVADAELYGLDGSLEYDLLKGLTAFGGVGYVVGRAVGSHAPLNSIPPLNGRAGLRWQDELAGKVKYWIELSSQIYAKQDDPAVGESATPGYAVFHLRTGLKYKYGKLKDLTFTVNAENLFDKKYRSHLNLADFVSEPGINIVTALKLSF